MSGATIISNPKAGTMSKIVRLEASNFKRLKAVEISPDGNLITIAGRNGQGKSSILDAISAALGGVSSKTTPRPIRDGETKAQIVLETEDLVVTRKFTPSGSTLTVTTPDGAKYSKGQAKLDELLGKLSLDPLAFTQLSDKDQLAALLEIVDLPFDPDQLAAERADIFTRRTDVNRRVKELQAHVASLPEPSADLPAEEVSVSQLLAEYRAGVDNNESYSRAHTRAQNAELRVDQLREELAKAEAEEAHAKADYEAHPAPISLDTIQQKIDNAETVNAQVRSAKELASVNHHLAAAEHEAAKLTDGIADIDRKKAEGLAAAEFPVEGLGFDEDGVTYQGVPFKQASSAEQLRVSLAMAIALNPGLRVIRIADGSLLDSDNLALVQEMAETYDYQVWLEVVGDGNGAGIVIEDGEVA